MESREQSQVCKLSQDQLNELRHALQCWNDRITLKDLRLSERYANGEIHILLPSPIREWSGAYRPLSGRKPSAGAMYTQ